MKTTVYFVRHAEPDFSIREDEIRPLTAKGLEDAKRVAEVLADKGITAIYSSPYKRTVDTISAFADASDLEIKTNYDFRERCVGIWVEDFKVFAESQWKDFSYKLEGGECMKEVQQRNVAAFLQVLNENKGKHIAIATHGTAMSAIINYFDPTYGFDKFWAMAGIMPYILCCRFDGEKLEAVEEIELL